MLQRFWRWYERNYIFNLGLAAFLFSLQIIHLVWLTGFVVYARLFGAPLFEFNAFWQNVIVLVDYTEIPAIITTSLVYIYQLQKNFRAREVWMLIFLNLQWLHILWITDEFVVDQFAGSVVLWPMWLAWIAILIDYLELPVIFETFRHLFSAIKEKDLAKAKATLGK